MFSRELLDIFHTHIQICPDETLQGFHKCLYCFSMDIWMWVTLHLPLILCVKFSIFLFLGYICMCVSVYVYALVCIPQQTVVYCKWT